MEKHNYPVRFMVTVNIKLIITFNLIFSLYFANFNFKEVITNLLAQNNYLYYYYYY